jgi:hypothetical protein
MLEHDVYTSSWEHSHFDCVLGIIASSSSYPVHRSHLPAILSWQQACCTCKAASTRSHLRQRISSHVGAATCSAPASKNVRQLSRSLKLVYIEQESISELLSTI